MANAEKRIPIRSAGYDIARFKSKLKELTCRKMPGKVSDKIKRINQVIRGWINYYAL
ncbi:group II intron maturase-specific domain-containing protein, partial [Succiniclasticum sp.]|uniref:group II intron maturase-specific domain-containing protein n=1 Tax=Succiniclasticum sp. TaxID=2775030 RepID=UPI0034DB040C